MTRSYDAKPVAPPPGPASPIAGTPLGISLSMLQPRQGRTRRPGISKSIVSLSFKRAPRVAVGHSESSSAPRSPLIYRRGEGWVPSDVLKKTRSFVVGSLCAACICDDGHKPGVN
jgi:hypothetical protein